MTRHPLTLAVIVNLYPPYVVGGNEVLARDVVEALRARGHVVHVLTGHGLVAGSRLSAAARLRARTRW
jgi:hypothetical protein